MELRRKKIYIYNVGEREKERRWRRENKHGESKEIRDRETNLDG